jgi:hypothetical protein
LLRGGGGQEILPAQTAKALQRPTPLVPEWLGRQRGGFMGVVGFSEQGVADAPAEQMIGCRQQALFRGDATEDEVGVFGIRSQELTRGFHCGVNRLYSDLGRGQIPANEYVDVRNLAENGFHGRPPLLDHTPWKT